MSGGQREHRDIEKREQNTKAWGKHAGKKAGVNNKAPRREGMEEKQGKGTGNKARVSRTSLPRQEAAAQEPLLHMMSEEDRGREITEIYRREAERSHREMNY